MCEIKCPICGTLLEYDTGYDGDYSCAKCGRAKMFGSEELWQALTDSMKEYDLCHDALVERTKELDCVRKALDVAKERLKNTILDAEVSASPEYLASRAKETLAEITALEQKDK